jgi:hypothetical protein
LGKYDKTNELNANMTKEMGCGLVWAERGDSEGGKGGV